MDVCAQGLFEATLPRPCVLQCRLSFLFKPVSLPLMYSESGTRVKPFPRVLPIRRRLAPGRVRSLQHRRGSWLVHVPWSYSGDRKSVV